MGDSLIFIFGLVYLGAITLVPPSKVFAEPGQEKVLEAATFEGKVYVTAISADGKGDTRAEFIWIPEEIEEGCLNHDLAHCESLANCWIFPDEQVCQDNQTMSQCKTRTRPACEKFQKYVVLKRGKSPNTKEVQRASPIQLPQRIKDTLTKWQKGPGMRPTGLNTTITTAKSFSAKIKWERWTNGESIEILEFK